MNRCRVVLVGTQIAANLGSAARVMRNFGSSDLVLVTPECDPRSEQARVVSTHGESILDNCRIVERLDDALADSVLVAGTSARTGGLFRRQTVATPDAVAEQLAESMSAGVVALVFGPERTGLDNDSIQRCHHLIHIPADESYPALNLAQSVAICLYEVRRVWLRRETPSVKSEVAPYQMQERMFAQLHDALAEIRYLREVRGEALMHALRHLIARAQPSPMEVNLLLGLARQLRWVMSHARLPEENLSDESVD